MDVLSRLIQSLELQGRLDLRCELGADWVADHASLPVGHAPYHIVLSGQCMLELPGSKQQLVLGAGDILVLPRGAHHLLRNRGDSRPPERQAQPMRLQHEGILAVKRNVACSDVEVEILCGVFEFNAQRRSVLVGSLPDHFVVSTSAGPELENLRSLVRLMSHESAQGGLGAQAIVNDLSTALFAMVLRAYLATQTVAIGTLALLTSSAMRPALQAMLDDLGRAWAVADLAQLTHMSRPSFARSFHRLSGSTPISMLTQLRMERAAARLVQSTESIGDIAEAVGYQSEAAFNRAFTRYAGLGPGSFRRRAKA